LADIRLVLAVDSAGAVKSVKTFNDEVEKVPAAAKKADGAVGGLRKVFDDFATGLSFGAGFAVAQKGFAMMVNGAAALGDALAKVMGLLLTYSDRMVTIGQRTGLATSSLQVLNLMAKTGGTELDTLAKAAVRMEVAIGKGDGAFKKLGLSLSDLKQMSPDAAFAKVSQAIGGIESPMQRAAAAVAIFGKSGAELLPVFAANMGEAKRQAEDLGLVISDKTLQAAERLGDAVDTTGLAFDAFLMRLAGVIAETPAVMQAVEGLASAFGSMSKYLESNADVFRKWANIAALMLTEVAASMATLLDLFAKIAGSNFAKTFLVGFAVEASGIDKVTESLKKYAQGAQDAVLARMKWAANDMGGKGVLLPGGVLPKQGGGSFGGFGTGEVDQKANAAAKKAAELVFKLFELPMLQQYARINTNMTMTMPGIATSISQPWLAGAPTKRGADPFSVLAGSGGLMSDPTFVSKMHSAYTEPIVKSTFSASQALQNLANIAQLSGSKLGKALAGIAGGGAGLSGGLSALKGAGALSGLTGILGKAGAYGQIAASSIGIISSIWGMFKKKPKEPPPEPPKKATDEAWRNFTSDQQSKGAAGVLAGVSGIRVTTPEDMAAQASIASQSFWAMFKTQGLVKAADAFKAVRDKMVETFKAAGADESAIGALIGPMSGLVDLADTEAFRGAADGANGFAQALASIANEQLPMSIDQFKAFEQQAVQGYEAMKAAAIAQGMSSEEAIKTAIQGSGQLLTTLKDASAKYGIGLGGSQALFDQAAAAGIAFGGSSEERLIMSLDRLTETLGGAPPKFQAALSASQVGGRISDGFSSNGMTDPGAIGDAIAAKLNASFDKVAGVIAGLADRPIEVSSTLNINGDALAGSLASSLDGGGDGASRMRSALAGRG